METLRVIDEIAGVHFEEIRKQHSRVVSQMPPASVLDLRQVRLADGPVTLFFDCADHLLLRHLPA